MLISRSGSKALSRSECLRTNWVGCQENHFGQSQFSGAILKYLHQSGCLSNYWRNFWNIFNDSSHPFIFFFSYFSQVPLWDKSQPKIAPRLDRRSHSCSGLFVDQMCPNQLSNLIKLIIFKLIISFLSILSAVLLHNPINKSATFTDMLDVIFFLNAVQIIREKYSPTVISVKGLILFRSLFFIPETAWHD